MENAPSITCPKCGETSYKVNYVKARFCGRCGFHAYLKEPLKKTESKAKLLQYIKNPEGLPEPLLFNFDGFSKKQILEQFWFDHLTRDKGLTPLENAKETRPYSLDLLSMDYCIVDEDMSFCYPEGRPAKALFGIALNGGLVVFYHSEYVWFKEPDGSECWAQMM